MKEGSLNYSDEQAYRIAYLIAGYIRKTLTVEEHDELDAWVEASDDNMRLFEDLTDEKNIETNLQWMEKVQSEKALREIKAKLRFEPEKPAKKPIAWWPYIAAASIILAVAAWFFFRSETTATPDIANHSSPEKDVLPGGNRATLTLSDGTTVDLEKMTSPVINDKGTTISKKAEGELMYAKLTQVKEMTYNTLSTPKGGQYSLTLSDGTKVWLNAQSSIRYPVQFNSTERTVELTGEGYFEVAKNADRPFIVRLPENEEIRVLGTEFNVMAYPNEETRKVTLVEGRVQVKNKLNQLQLKPGQQALMKTGTIALNTKTDIDVATGWKKGEFIFHDMKIYELMRQVERWYDVNVIFKTTTAEHFNATISRNEPVSKLLRLLEHTGKIHFKIENKTIYVLP